MQGLVKDDDCIAALGEELGSGSSRVVYTVRGDASVVIKKIRVTSPAANFLEWTIWQAVKNTKLAGTFGVCQAISETGRYLVMERLDDVPEKHWANCPDVPEWLNDPKPSAYGVSATGTIKVRDYAMLSLAPTLEAAPTVPAGFVANARLVALKAGLRSGSPPGASESPTQSD